MCKDKVLVYNLLKFLDIDSFNIKVLVQYLNIIILFKYNYIDKRIIIKYKGK